MANNISGPNWIHELLNHLRESLLVVDASERLIVYVSPSAGALLGIDPPTSQPLSRDQSFPLEQVLGAVAPDALTDGARLSLNPPGRMGVEARVHVLSGGLRLLRLDNPATMDGNGTLFETMFRRHGAVMMMVEPMSRRILDVNAAAEAFYGYRRQTLVGMSIDQVNTLGPEAIDQELESAASESRNYFVFPHRIASGEIRMVEVHSTPIDYGGRQVLFSIIHDITERKAAEERLHYLAHYDALTGLGNRSYLTLRMEHALAHAERRGTRVAVLFLDLDRFKNINDSLGHPSGDEVLVSIARSLRSRLRSDDTLVRLGGDEFLVMVEGAGGPEEIAGLARSLIEKVNEPATLANGQEVFVGCSVGISLYPDDAYTATQLIRNADTALYQAKHQGRNTFHFYTRALTTAASERLEVEAALRRGLKHEEFCLHYQPVVEVGSGRVVGAEALVRWQTPDGGMIPPGRFIPIAEETGLILPLGSWVLAQACREAVVLQQAYPDFRLAVNISMRQLEQPGLADQVAQVLRETGLPPQALELEITETDIMRQGGAAPATLSQLKSLGIGLAIDDFGTGYSSLAYLKRFAVDKLKVDRSFINDIPDDVNDVELVITILLMARNLGLRVVAEGVETQSQLDFLKQSQCDLFQGFLFSKPVPIDEFRRRFMGSPESGDPAVDDG